MGLTTSTEGKLSEDELAMVKDSWKIVMNNPQENGVAIFKAFLEKYNYYSRFEKFKDIPLSELSESKAFQNHALAIIKAINHITEHINDEEKLKSLLLALGKQHKKHNITETQFNELKSVILDVLSSVFNLPPEGIKAWDKTFDIAFAYVFQGLEGQ